MKHHLSLKFEFEVPQNVFFDPDGDKLSYSAYNEEMSGLEGDLPSWLKFEPLVRRFIGTPIMATDLITYKIILKAKDPFNQESASTSFLLTVYNNPHRVVVEDLGILYLKLGGSPLDKSIPSNIF